MTGRRRRPGGSSGHGSNGGSPDSPRARTTPGPVGGDGVGAHVDGIDTMAGRLDATRGKIDGVTNSVASVNVGPQSMGVIGSSFTGAAQSHVDTARQHLTRATKAVENAQRGTRSTAAAYRETDTTSAQSLSKIDTTARPPTTQSTSTPAHGTTPSPGASSTPTVGRGSTTPSSATQSPTPTRQTPVRQSRPVGEPWTDTVRNNFSPKDFADFQRAMDKISADPVPGQVPGSGTLTARERDLVARARGLVTIEPGTVMQKIIPPDAVKGYLGDLRSDGSYEGGSYKSVRGFVARHQDAMGFNTPDSIFNGTRLDYPNTGYRTGMDHIHAIEFPAGKPDNYTTPIGAPSVPGELSGKNPAVNRAADAMMDAMNRAGMDETAYNRNVSAWPFSGMGVTAHSSGIPEFVIGSEMKIPNGATINEYDQAGRKTVVAVFDKVSGRWVQP